MLLNGIGVELPVIAAPMAGGASRPSLAAAAARAGALGFLAGGYRTAADLHAQIQQTRALGAPFGVNLFVPNPMPVERDAYRRYAQTLKPEADRLGVQLPAAPVEDEDDLAAKLDLLLCDPVPVASFTFGIPESSLVAQLRRRGTIVVQTVTSAQEALGAEAAGVDAVAVQCSAAGGHSGTLAPHQPIADVPIADLLRSVRAVVGLPMIAAGGLATADAVADALAAGADAAMVGTVLLRTDESGASATHQQALADAPDAQTVLTRAFTGRPARALPNAFIARYERLAPSGYPAIHHLTSPIRRAAAAAGDRERVHLWAGAGHRHAQLGPAENVLRGLASRV